MMDIHSLREVGDAGRVDEEVSAVSGVTDSATHRLTATAPLGIRRPEAFQFRSVTIYSLESSGSSKVQSCEILYKEIRLASTDLGSFLSLPGTP